MAWITLLGCRCHGSDRDSSYVQCSPVFSLCSLLTCVPVWHYLLLTEFDRHQLCVKSCPLLGLWLANPNHPNQRRRFLRILTNQRQNCQNSGRKKNHVSVCVCVVGVVYVLGPWGKFKMYILTELNSALALAHTWSIFSHLHPAQILLVSYFSSPDCLPGDMLTLPGVTSVFLACCKHGICAVNPQSPIFSCFSMAACATDVLISMISSFIFQTNH